jgi:ribokinase
VKIAVVGSVNLDLVARCERLPRSGETISGAHIDRFPGGKGANQAVAAARLGADVSFTGMVATDDLADDALSGLEEAGVDVSAVGWISEPGMHTGVALIVVADDGENQIVVAPGANARLSARDVEVGDADAVICQLEIPDDAVAAAASQARFLCLNAAPARQIDVASDLIVVNQLEREIVGDGPTLTAVTLGAAGAVLLEAGVEIASAVPPDVDVVDTTAAGDAFTACLVISLLEERPRDEALARACAAGALAASKPGAQPSLPTATQVDAILAR